MDSAKIHIELLEDSSELKMNLYTLQGKHLQELTNGTLPQGIHEIEWQVQSNQISSGIYMLIIDHNNKRTISKLMVIK